MLIRWTIVAVLFNIVDIKVGWLVVELELLDRPTRHEPVEVRCAEVASCVHGGEWLEIGGDSRRQAHLFIWKTKNMVAVSWSSTIQARIVIGVHIFIFGLV